MNQERKKKEKMENQQQSNKQVAGLYYESFQNANSTHNIVFVHGSGCNHQFLKPLAEKLTDFNCYLIDLPDHGKSPVRNVKQVDEYIDAVAEFVSRLEHVIIVGHSLGGTICLGVAAKQIPSVEKSIIISSAAKFDLFDKRIYKMVEKWRVDWLYIMKCLGSAHNPIVLSRLLTMEEPDVLLKDFKIDIELDQESIMQNITIPTLILVGSRDILTQPEYSYRMRKAIKGSKLVIIPGYKHMLPIAKRKTVARIIRRFIHL